MPPALLPEAFGDWIMDAADRMQIGPEMIAASAMVAFGSLVGRALAIRPQRRDDWYELGNLGSDRRSASDVEDRRPVRRHAARSETSSGGAAAARRSSDSDGSRSGKRSPFGWRRLHAQPREEKAIRRERVKNSPNCVSADRDYAG